MTRSDYIISWSSPAGRRVRKFAINSAASTLGDGLTPFFHRPRRAPATSALAATRCPCDRRDA
jgi:hypothetical protein